MSNEYINMVLYGICECLVLESALREVKLRLLNEDNGPNGKDSEVNEEEHLQWHDLH